MESIDYNFFTDKELELVLTFLTETIGFLNNFEILDEFYEELVLLKYKVMDLIDPHQEHENFTSCEIKLVFNCYVAITNISNNSKYYTQTPIYDNLNLKMEKIASEMNISPRKNYD